MLVERGFVGRVIYRSSLYLKISPRQFLKLHPSGTKQELSKGLVPRQTVPFIVNQQWTSGTAGSYLEPERLKLTYVFQR